MTRVGCLITRNEDADATASDSRPAWWLLYAIAALLVAVVGLVDRLVDGEGLRKILETLTVVAGIGTVVVWRRLNRIALELEQGRRRR